MIWPALALEFASLLTALLGAFTALTLWRAARHERRAMASHPPQGQIIDVDGHAVHTKVIGSGPDLVLIHGASGNMRDFTNGLAEKLALDYRVILLDRPGLGYSARLGSSGATITQQADLLHRAARQLGADRPIVVGQSYGGAVALAWAVTKPDALSALVPSAAASNPWTTPLSRFYQITSHPLIGPLVIPLLTAWVRDQTVATALDEVFAPQQHPPGYNEHIGTGLTLRRSTLRENALQRANLLGEITALFPRYGQITVPTEIIHGTADTTVSIHIHSEKLVHQIPGATLTALPDIGHMPHHNAQPAVIAAIHRAATRAGLR